MDGPLMRTLPRPPRRHRMHGTKARALIAVSAIPCFCASLAPPAYPSAGRLQGWAAQRPLRRCAAQPRRRRWRGRPRGPRGGGVIPVRRWASGRRGGRGAPGGGGQLDAGAASGSWPAAPAANGGCCRRGGGRAAASVRTGGVSRHGGHGRRPWAESPPCHSRAVVGHKRIAQHAGHGPVRR